MTSPIGSIAQSFYVDSAIGCFVSSIGLYFYGQTTMPVTVDIRLVENGIPTNYVAARKVLPATSINVSSDSSVETKFTFDHPIYLEGERDYAFVVLTNSVDLNVWVATMGKKSYSVGDTDAPTGEYITKQPYVGSMFSSENDRTWVPESTSDIKFKIYRANFTKTSGYAYLQNGKPTAHVDSAYTSKLVDPFEFTSGSTLVTVDHPSHGLSTGDTVRYSTLEHGLLATFGGIPNNVLFGVDYPVTRLTSDKYTITLSVAANTTIKTGQKVLATDKVVFGEAILKASAVSPKSTTLEYSVSAKDVGSNFSPWKPVLPEGVVTFDTLRKSSQASDGSALIAASLRAVDGGFVSPVIDLNDIGLVAVANRVTSKATGPMLANYTQQPITLKNAADSFLLFVDVNRPFGTEIQVQYRIGQDNVKDADWVDAVLDSPAPFASDPTSFTEYKFVQASVVNYSVIQVRILFWSDNEAKVPRCRNLRTITLKS